MIERKYNTDSGTIIYYINEFIKGRKNLIFLPGLTADHRLFEKQTDYFKDKYNVLVWDAPGHYRSRPFKLDFDLKDKAIWLKEILKKEEIDDPIIIGQSMGGYVGQMYLQLYDDAAGFISIDSAPLQKKYVTDIEIWLLKKIEPFYRMFSWKILLPLGTKGVAVSEYGQKLMEKMMKEYEDDIDFYYSLSGHGYKMLGMAMEKDLEYKIYCPSILLCGEKDMSGSAKNYNRRWHRNTGIELRWIKNAGHNSNTDQPEEVNSIIEQFVESI